MKPSLLLLAAMAGSFATVTAEDTKVAAQAVNALGVDLYHQQSSGDGNLALSPYSIQSALAMTYAGAAGDTRTEMQHVLQFPDDEQALHRSFKSLAAALARMTAKSIEAANQSEQSGGPKSPIELNLANRLFARPGKDFHAPFIDLLKQTYGAPLQQMDFAKNAKTATQQINKWIADQTKGRIHDFLPPDSINPKTSLFLVNALYLHAPWATAFDEKHTGNEPFYVHGKDKVDVPTMDNVSRCGFVDPEGFKVITRPYAGGELQFVIILPDKPDGLAGFERALSPEALAELTRLPLRSINLHLPKFRLEPPTVSLTPALKALGIKRAFDDPKGSADFTHMATPEPPLYYALNEVLHQSIVALDEKGTEAAVATVAMMAPHFGGNDGVAIEVRVDHPFIFAIQHVPSGACLFLGRVTDPR